ncbi:MAG: hypothetical protein JSV65_00820 [Armatimonadota bacterium]|nr:MAG: hypothetical protein JSV65_00820 [Armatimonadota bacterium]
MAGLLEAIDYLLKRFFASAELRAYESLCLDGWKGVLSAEAVAILDRQLRLPNRRVQRGFAGKVVVSYCLGDPDCEKLPPETRFLLQSETSITFASIVIRGKGPHKGPHSLKANILLSDGIFGALVFDRKPHTVFDYPKGVKRDEIEVIEVRVLIDPMCPEALATQPIPDSSALLGWVREWAETRQARDLRTPLSAGARERILQNLDARLPDDYLDVIAQTEGLRMGACQVRGLSEIPTVPEPEATFYILADIDDRGGVGVAQGGTDAELYYLDNDDEPRAVGTSVRAVIEKELTRRAEEGAE